MTKQWGIGSVAMSGARETVIDGFAQTFIGNAGYGDPVSHRIELAQHGEEICRRFEEASFW